MFSPLKTLENVTADVGSVVETIKEKAPDPHSGDMNPMQKISDVVETVTGTAAEPAKVIKDAVNESIGAVSDAVLNAVNAMQSLPMKPGHQNPMQKFGNLLEPLGCLNKLTYFITMDWTNFFFGLFSDILEKVFKQVNKYLKLASAQGM